MTFPGRALAGRRVLVVRPEGQSDSLAEALVQAGALPILWPAISIGPPEDDAPLLRAAREIDQYQWVVFTSANGVRALLNAIERVGGIPQALRGLQIAAIGPATASALEQVGLSADRIPTSFIAESLLDSLCDVRGRVLLPRAEEARPVLSDGLRAQGAIVDAVVAYRAVPRALDPEVLAALASGRLDDVTLTSGSTARALSRALKSGGIEPLSLKARVVCIGPITASAAVESGFSVTAVAKEYSVPGLVRALSQEVLPSNP